jgi:glycosyltransferase involved in cell wall biosynthesis/predicted metal-dependent phosphoesterase TrpH
MIFADLHVHSTASKRPSEWFLKKVGARESYTDIETLYWTAKNENMDFVTVTDHNTIENALTLHQKHPDDTFISVEVTTYFPENGCKIHVLVYDITQLQFEIIDAIRKDIYQLRDYLKSENLAHSVAHATYSINKRLTMEVLEKLILLFDVFEGLNGARNRLYSETWVKTLKNLTPEIIDTLKAKHSIEPISEDPWIKGFTGGSDDHAGLFIGQTYTTAVCSSKKELIEHIKNKKTLCEGRCNDYKSFAFSIYKIFCDYSRKGKEEKDRILLKFFDHIREWSQDSHLTVEQKMDSIYDNLADLYDDFVIMITQSMIKSAKKGEAAGLVKNFSALLPVMFITVPFFSSLKQLFLDRNLIQGLRDKYIKNGDSSENRALWFTDTIDDLNGVAVNLQNYMRTVHQRDMNVKFVVCRNENAGTMPLPNTINLPRIFSYTPDFYNTYTLNIPSLLKSVDMIYKYAPEEIIISTPGPVGIIGLLMAKLTGVKCTGIFHTDFSYQAEMILEDEGIASFVQTYLYWFYSFTDEIKVPTAEYIHILDERGFDRSRMGVIKRGFDVKVPELSREDRREFLDDLGIPEGITLLFAGRVSRDKNIDFLTDAYKKVLKNRPEVNLVIAGNGPDLERMKEVMNGYDRVFFTGRIPNEKLLKLYTCSDIFAFPSTTDTFGMVVLESLACGLPALVSDTGGPKEIVRDKINGHVLPVSDIGVWAGKILEIIRMIEGKDPAYTAMCERAREHVTEHYCWDEALNDILGSQNFETASDRKIKIKKHNNLPAETAPAPGQKEFAVA